MRTPLTPGSPRLRYLSDHARRSISPRARHPDRRRCLRHRPRRPQALPQAWRLRRRTVHPTRPLRLRQRPRPQPHRHRQQRRDHVPHPHRHPDLRRLPPPLGGQRHRLRMDRQTCVPPPSHRRPPLRRLRHHQGRRPRHDPRHRHGRCPIPHPLQCRLPRHHRHPHVSPLPRHPARSPPRRPTPRRPIPLGRIGTPRDVAGLVAFLLSLDAAWINGSEFVIDGGFLAKGTND